MWLNSNPHLHVYSFDIGRHGYTRPMVKVLQRMFPGRLNVTLGDSRKTLPNFRKMYPNVKCDLTIIDGGHKGDVPRLDFENFYNMVEPLSDNLVILDDWPSTYFVPKDEGTMWLNAVEKGKIQTLRQCMNKKSRKGMTIGQFLR